MRSRPKPSTGHGDSEATHSAAVIREGASVRVTECGKLAPVAVELLALRLDDLRRRAIDETRVGEHPLCARDLLAEPLAFGLDVAVCLGPIGSHHGREDTRVVRRVELDLHPAAPEDLG